jgi:hypothetical protein
MMDPKNPKPGDLHIDATDIKTVDLFPEQVSRLSKTRPGFDIAVACLLRLSPELIDRAGINPAVVQWEARP